MAARARASSRATAPPARSSARGPCARAIDAARAHGVGAAVAFNCNHFGAASYYAALALEQGMFGVCACNAGPNVAPFGGARPLHGTNPIAYAAPGGEEPPIVLDIATSAAATARSPRPAGAASRSRSAGRSTPTAARRPTRPAGHAAAVRRHKGYGIGVLVDLLTGALAGSTIGLDVRQGDPDREHAGQSFFLLAIDPAAFGGAGAFKAREHPRPARSTARPAEGFERVLLPGELECARSSSAAPTGIPLYDEDWAALVRGVDAPAGLPGARRRVRSAPRGGVVSADYTAGAVNTEGYVRALGR